MGLEPRAELKEQLGVLGKCRDSLFDGELDEKMNIEVFQRLILERGMS